MELYICEGESAKKFSSPIICYQDWYKDCDSNCTDIRFGSENRQYDKINGIKYDIKILKLLSNYGSLSFEESILLLEKFKDPILCIIELDKKIELIFLK